MGAGAALASKYVLSNPIIERKVSQIIQHQELVEIMGDLETSPGQKMVELKKKVAQSIEVWDQMYEAGVASVDGEQPDSYAVCFIADNDKLSRVKDDDGNVAAYESRMQMATLKYSVPSHSKVKQYKLDMGDKKKIVIAEGDDSKRGAELSCATQSKGKLLSGCDRTGRVFSIEKGEEHLNVTELCVCKQHDGEDKGLKIEWAVEKDGCLFVGSHGRFEGMPGETCRTRMRHIVKVNEDWSTEDLDWTKHYDAMCGALGVEGADSLEGTEAGYAGYVTHESALYSDIHKRWFFFPRKVSYEKYDFKTDPYCGADSFICYDEETMKCWITPMLGRVVSKGVADMCFIPGTGDTEILVIRTVENDDGPMESHASVFNLKGDILMQEVQISEDMKYEGCEVLSPDLVEKLI